MNYINNLLHLQRLGGAGELRIRQAWWAEMEPVHARAKDRLLELAPELTEEAEALRGLFGADYCPSAMVFFDDLLGPFLSRLLTEPSRVAECGELFGFFEELANSEHEQEVLCVSYALPRALQGDPAALKAADRHLGPSSRDLVREYLLRWTTWTRRSLPWSSAV